MNRNTYGRLPRAAKCLVCSIATALISVALAGCSDPSPKTALQEAQEAREAAEQSLEDAEDSLGNVEDSLDTAGDQIDASAEDKAALKDTIENLQRQVQSLQSELAAERAARQQAEESLAEVRRTLNESPAEPAETLPNATEGAGAVETDPVDSGQQAPADEGPG